MSLPSLNPKSPLAKMAAMRKLARLLQDAHAGERAAANAYWGHAYSFFVTDKVEKEEILNIYKDELHHRKRLFEMLKSMNEKPRTLRELLMFMVGFTIGFLCLFGGWFIPMYGAGKLESTNIMEYEVAARLALLAGREDLVAELLEFAEVEWDHELYFRKKAQSHWMSKLIPIWPDPPSRESIQQSYAVFKTELVGVGPREELATT